MKQQAPGLLHKLLPQRLQHWARAVGSAEYRREMLELRKLGNMPRYTQTTTTLPGAEFIVPDALSFIHSYQEIFRNRIYEFRSDKPDPVIFDCGANIGLSVLFFKRLFPQSRVLAFEADPHIFQILARNCTALGLSQVELINKAVWTSETTLDFAQEGADAGRMHQPGEAAQTVAVPACRLRDFLQQQSVDFLKIDIEGAETAVLLDCADSLANVKHLFVEYHSFISEQQKLASLLDVLTRAGFRFQIQAINGCEQPFVSHSAYLGMDLQLNIFAYRSL